jgi:hypothetical protein
MRFEDFRHGLIKPVIATFYHWSAPEDRPVNHKLTKDTLREDQVFYLSDDTHTWASPLIHGMKLYAVDCRIRRPFPMFEQLATPEVLTDITQEMMTDGDFDCVIYTPHPFGRGVREMALFFPQEQIVSIREIPRVNLQELQAARRSAHVNFTALRGWGDEGLDQNARFDLDARTTPPWEEVNPRPALLEAGFVNEFHQLMDEMRRTAHELSLIRNPEPPKHAVASAENYAERVILISKFPHSFKMQQASAAAEEGITLYENQMFLNGWVMDHKHSLDEIKLALKADPDALLAMAGVEFTGVDPEVWALQRKLRKQGKPRAQQTNQTAHQET